jgi:hypothetical protein
VSYLKAHATAITALQSLTDKELQSFLNRSLNVRN